MKEKWKEEGEKEGRRRIYMVCEWASEWLTRYNKLYEIKGGGTCPQGIPWGSQIHVT